jgi:hypothetical protein
LLLVRGALGRLEEVLARLELEVDLPRPHISRRPHPSVAEARRTLRGCCAGGNGVYTFLAGAGGG